MKKSFLNFKTFNQIIKNNFTGKAFLKGFTLFLFSFCTSVLIIAGFSAYTVWQKYQVFLNSAKITHPEFLNTVQEATRIKDELAPQQTFLILGVDVVQNRGDIPPLTDTMMLASINHQTGQINLLSLPRDLWNEKFKTKINALLAYGLERYPQEPVKFPQEVIAEMASIQIDHTLVISLSQLAELIDLVGGVKIEVKQGFIDPQYPRSDIDIQQEADPAKLYKTVEFKPGYQEMSGQRALEYIRSRKSENDQGNDLARGKRQQEVIQALLQQLTQINQYWYQPQKAGQLFKFYQQYFAQSLLLKQALALAVKMAQAPKLNLKTYSLPVYPEDQAGVIYHPQTQTQQYQDQWIYLVKDHKEFKVFINQVTN